jgi:hypothetical protein
MEIARRIQGEKSLYFLLNHSDSPQTVHVTYPSQNLLNHMGLIGEVQVLPRDVLILVSDEGPNPLLKEMK